MHMFIMYIVYLLYDKALRSYIYICKLQLAKLAENFEGTYEHPVGNKGEKIDFFLN